MTSETAAKKDTQKLQRAIVDGLEDVKAQEIQVFNTEHLSALFERVIIASGTSNRQTKALAASVRDAVREAGFPKPRIEGEENGEWIIVDCGAAVAHIMQPAIRQYYHLEEIWGDKPVRLKFGAPRPSSAEPEPEPEPVRKAAGKKAPAKKKAGEKTGARTAARKAALSGPTRSAAPGKKAAPGAAKTKIPYVTVGKPTPKTATRSVSQASPKPVGPGARAPAKTARPAAKPAARPAARPAAKPAAKSAARPAAKKAPARKA